MVNPTAPHIRPWADNKTLTDDQIALVEVVEAELRAKYRWPFIAAVYHTLQDAVSGLYTSRVEGYYPEPFCVDVLADWNHLGVTAFTTGDNNMGQSVELVLQANLDPTAFNDPIPHSSYV